VAHALALALQQAARIAQRRAAKEAELQVVDVGADVGDWRLAGEPAADAPRHRCDESGAGRGADSAQRLDQAARARGLVGGAGGMCGPSQTLCALFVDFVALVP
jgi:hypothetical protein